jgi:cobalt-zinc-cadmium efflux system outer membrane protein
MSERNEPSRLLSAWAVAALLLASGSKAFGQAAEFDVPNPPGVAEGRNLLGPAPGASGSSSFAPSSMGVMGGRAGPSVTRAPLNSATPPGMRRPWEGLPNFKVPAIPEASVPAYGALDLPAADVSVGPEDGYSLDDAVQLLMERNLELLALKFEVPMAEADILTASLRANPIFYADTQLVPYGAYTSGRPGGQTQYDINITYPIDVNNKRKARMESAQVARRAVEAQLQDAARRQVDNLYTAFVDVAAADLTLEYSRKYQEGIGQLLSINEDLLEKEQIPEDPVFALRAQRDLARLQIREAEQALVRTTRTLAQLMNIPREQAAAVRIRDKLRDDRPIPMSEDALIDLALERRPDLQAQRLGVQRAHADVRLAKRERLSDFYLLYQPYTFQDNSPVGLNAARSWAVGITAPMPIYNRNQGNIARAELNVSQTHVEMDHAVRLVQDEVSDAVREFDLSRQAMIDSETEILPSSRRVRDAAYRRWQGGETSIVEFLDAQRDFNGRVREYRDAIVRHRRAVLDLNTAVGARLLP